MFLPRQIARGLRALFKRAAAERDIRDEVQHFFDEAAGAWSSRGLSPDEARRAAIVELGNTTIVEEQVREAGWEHIVEEVAADVRYAARGLRARPAFAVVTIMTLAIGIGATTAIFSAVDPILLEPLPYPDPSRVVMVWYAGADGSRAAQSFGTFRELSTRTRAFAAMAVFKPWQPTMTGPGEPERIDGQQVSADYFRVLGIPPSLGRGFDAVDDRLHGADVAIVSDALWRRRFASDRSIVGRQITLNDRLYTVVGVMPASFENVLAPTADIWSPLQYDASLPADGREWGHHLRLVGRVRPGISVADARRDLDAIARTPIADFSRRPGSTLAQGVITESLRDNVTRAVKPALLAVTGAVLLVLVIACVNVTSLLMARGVQRRGEFAMRAALGASPTRLVRQLIAESLLVALIGGGAAIVFAEAGILALVAISPPELPRLGAIAVNGSVFVFALAVSTLVGVAVGLTPAVHAFRDDLRAGLQQGARVPGGRQRTRRALVVAEVALAIVLLACAGLLLRSLDRLFAIAPGFDAADGLVMQVQVSSASRFADDRAVHQFFARALDAVRTVPGVRAAAFSSELPLTGDDATLEVYSVRFEARGSGEAAQIDAYRYAVTPGYFETMGIPLRRGRWFVDTDRAGAPVRPVVISESLARRAFPGRDPVGQRVQFAGPANRPWDLVVGVVGDVKQTSLAGKNAEAVYVNTDQWLWADHTLWLAVRLRGDAANMAPAIRRAIWSVDKDQPIVRVATMERLLAASEAERRFALAVFEAFGAVALALAAIGLYGILAGTVSERTREIGVRSALGASRSDILALVVTQGLALTACGVAIGLGGALVASRAMITLLFGISPVDAPTYAGAAVLLFGVAAAASAIPAWRAARVDPSTALRAD
jgi:putative ABC transport system permease protein